MLNLTPSFFAIAIPAVIFAGISKGGFGSGAAFVSAAILAVVLDPGLALGVMLPLLMLIDLATLGPFWKRWSAPDAKVLIIGGIPGVVAGAALYKYTEPDVFRVLIGLMALGFVVWQFAQSRARSSIAARNLPHWVGLGAGVAAGFTSFVSHAGGPPAAAYLLSRRLDKTTYQGTTVLVFWALNITKFVPYAALGMFSFSTFTANLALAPFALLGTWIGVRAHHKVPERLFFGLTYVLLTLTGAKLVWDGMT